jgi:hypothetical protein
VMATGHDILSNVIVRESGRSSTLRVRPFGRGLLDARLHGHDSLSVKKFCAHV